MKGRRLGLALLLLALLPVAARAHPYSTTRAELDWQAESHRFEVSLMVLPEELAQMIDASRPSGGKPFRLDASAECDAAIQRYLERHFVLEGQDGRQARLEWVGKELAFEATWLYFELVLPEGRPEDPSGLTLRVDLGFELSHEHLNAVKLRHGGRWQGLLFSRLRPVFTLGASGSAPAG